MYKAATDPAEKERLLLALGYAPGADRLNSTLDFALTPDVRAQVRQCWAACRMPLCMTGPP